MGRLNIEFITFFNCKQGSTFLQGKIFNPLKQRPPRVFKLAVITGGGIDGFFADFYLHATFTHDHNFVARL